ncbi:MAG: Glu-tRNA(Gln) amidotransferase subunit GatE, partial [Candidatus Ranarchaeia archaeon]
MNPPSPLDYKKLGLKVGLELHQQLNTKTKLFCNDSTQLLEDEPDFVIRRQLRPTQSELGEVDQAALFEFLKGQSFVYEGYNANTCLVEQDEEPPHDLDNEAIDIALTVSYLLNSNPVDEIHVMRKIVIDGSNTGGFQRTSIIALGGFVKDETFDSVGIQTICLEEDAARKISETENEVRYRLDRLGVPLIEVATAPDIHDPVTAEKVALKIGQLLRATRKVKRGIGTIRQDVNISITDGNLVEIKGVQQLDIISDLVVFEVTRQLSLLKIRDELQKRKLTATSFPQKIKDVTSIFSETKCKPIKKAISNKGRVLALKFPKCKGIIGLELQPNRRFGSELADYAKYRSGVKGIFHTDELPGYGITENDVKKLHKVLNTMEDDAIILVAAPQTLGEQALKVVTERMITALEGVPKETRGAKIDGTTVFLRPRPGAKRMYPETDVHPKKITSAHLAQIKDNLPEKPEDHLKKFMAKYNLNKQIATEILDSPRDELFETIVSTTKASPKVVATTLGSLWVSLRREGIDLNIIKKSTLIDIFHSLKVGQISKDTLEDILIWLVKNPSKKIEDAISQLGYSEVSPDEVTQFIKQLIEKNRPLIMSK